MPRIKKTRTISLTAPKGYWWVGRRCLPDNEVWDNEGLCMHNSCTNTREFRTSRKAFNVLFSLPKGLGASLLQEYWIKKRRLVKGRYFFNSIKDVQEYDKSYEKYLNNKREEEKERQFDSCKLLGE
jgi:hypothetical protein